MARILHTADVHLGRSWGSLGPIAARLSELHWECFENICRLAAERAVAALVIAGDLFERADPPAKLIDQVRAVFKRLTSAGPAVVLVPGTHDHACSARALYRSANLGGARVFTAPRLGERMLVGRGDAAVAFHGLAWDPQATPENFLDDFRRADGDAPEVLVLHADVGPAASGRGQDLPVKARALAAAGADYVALGHRHAYQEFRREGRLWGAYAGTPFGLSFREPELGPRTVSLVTLAPGTEPAVERIASTEAAWKDVALDLTEAASQESAVAAAAAHGGPATVARLRLCGEAGFRPDAAAMTAALAGSFLHLEIEDATLSLSADFVEGLASENSVRGIFVRRMRERIEDAAGAEERAEAAAALREGLRALAGEGSG